MNIYAKEFHVDLIIVIHSFESVRENERGERGRERDLCVLGMFLPEPNPCCQCLPNVTQRTMAILFRIRLIANKTKIWGRASEKKEREA